MFWSKVMDELLDLFRPGRTIYLPGASGEILALNDRLSAEPERMAGVQIVSCLLPGFNSFDYAALHPTARVTTFLLPPQLRGSFERGQVRVVPLSYSGIATYLSQRMHIDVAVAHVAAPDVRGSASLGIAADFTELAFSNADVTVLAVNDQMPSVPLSPRLPLREADAVVRLSSPLVTAWPTRTDAAIDRIASLAAEHVPDGAALQIGIGGVPGAVWSKLRDHRNLTIASGLLAQDCKLLVDSGALSATRGHRAGVALGNAEFYTWLGDQDLIEMAGAARTHGARSLCTTPLLHAVNSALEVDLLGQANLEWRSGKLVSGVGGAPDFARGALASPGGRSILALPSTASDGRISRIVLRLDAPSVSLGRELADVIITEHGVADVRNLSIAERAFALIAIAAPQFRDALAEQWRDYARRF